MTSRKESISIFAGSIKRNILSKLQFCFNIYLFFLLTNVLMNITETMSIFVNYSNCISGVIEMRKELIYFSQ